MSKADLDQFLTGLIRRDADPETMGLRGHMLPGPDGYRRLVVSEIYLDLHPDDILSIRQVGDRPAAVEVALQSGATLHGVGPAAPFRDRIATGGVPFAVLTRPPDEAHRHSIEKRRDQFHQRECAFLKKYGLFPDDPDC